MGWGWVRVEHCTSDSKPPGHVVVTVALSDSDHDMVLDAPKHGSAIDRDRAHMDCAEHTAAHRKGLALMQKMGHQRPLDSKDSSIPTCRMRGMAYAQSRVPTVAHATIFERANGKAETRAGLAGLCRYVWEAFGAKTSYVYLFKRAHTSLKAANFSLFSMQ